MQTLMASFLENLRTESNSLLLDAVLNGYRTIFEGIDEDYRGEHKAPDKEDSAPLWDVSKGIFPPDIYTMGFQEAVRNYGDGESYDNESMSVILSCHNRPNAQVKIYRAVPDINREVNNKIDTLHYILYYFNKFGFLPRKDKVAWSYKDKYYTETEGFQEDYQRAVISDIQKDIQTLRNQLQDKIKINPGDWVTLSRSYAKDHGESNLLNKYKILTKTVNAKYLYTEGSINEFGYDPT